MAHSAARHVALFSYGTLQKDEVQLRQFGRLLEGAPDAVTGYKTVPTEILDADVLAISGLRFHPNLVATGNPEDAVTGMLYLISEAELRAADDYEVSDYRRIETRLKSGRTAWVYVRS